MSKKYYRHKDFRQRKKDILDECTTYCKEILKHIGFGILNKAACDECCFDKLICSAIDENGNKHKGYVHGVIYDEAKDAIKVLWSDDETSKLLWTSNITETGDCPLIINLYIRLRGRIYFPTNISGQERTALNNYIDTLPDQYFFFDKLMKLDEDICKECKKLLKKIGHSILLKPYSPFGDGNKFPHAIFDIGEYCEIFGLRYDKEGDEMGALLCNLNHEDEDYAYALWRVDVEWNEGREGPLIIHDMIVNQEYIVLPKELDFGWTDVLHYTDTIKIINETFNLYDE